MENNQTLNEKHFFVYSFLKDYYYSNSEFNGGWCSPTQIGKLYGIAFLNTSNCHSSTGSPILKILVKKGLAERSKNGHYRFLENNINVQVTYK